jgi:3alpha(or 20beta)-hydroxysteroid dehydrogenase
MGRLDDKVCVITGGARGQGAAEAARFIGEGATVYISDVLTDEGGKTAAETGATFVHHDVTQPEQWEALVAQVVGECGRLDVLVNNAGIFSRAGLHDATVEVWDRVVAINQTGVFLGMLAVTPQMKQQRSGSIINLSSVAGLKGFETIVYGATKWAVRGMTRCAAKELGPFGIRVNSIHPGLIDTPMVAGTNVEEGGLKVPLRRAGQPEDVAELALWLASDESSYSTGSEFVVDGGMTV